jgi:hypothetical protein
MDEHFDACEREYSARINLSPDQLRLRLQHYRDSMVSEYVDTTRQHLRELNQIRHNYNLRPLNSIPRIITHLNEVRAAQGLSLIGSGNGLN